MKESSLQTQSGISLPSQQRTCMQCMAYEQGWKEATLIKAIEPGITLPKLVHCMARLVHVESLLLQRCQLASRKVGVAKPVCILCLINQNLFPPPLLHILLLLPQQRTLTVKISM